MKICIPIETNEGLESRVNAHFGSAPYFLIYNIDKKDFNILDNSDKDHIHGMCNPLKILKNQNIGAIVCIGMGIMAIQRLKAGGIKTYRTNAKIVKEIIEGYNKNKLEEITVKNACIGHNCH